MLRWPMETTRTTSLACRSWQIRRRWRRPELHEPRGSLLGDEGELDAFPDGIDPFGAHADFIAQVPFELTGL
jgi:hypothetical protein